MSHRIVPAALLAVLTSLAIAACGGSSAEHAAQPQAAPLTLQQGCEAFFARARECTDPYLEGLVGLRIELDRPAGIAAQAAAEGKPALVAKAHEEWANDSTPEAIQANCARSVEAMPPDRAEAARVAGERCLATTDCDAFAACSVELQRPLMAGP